MRVTNNMLTSTMITNLNKNLRKMNEYQSQLATGKQVQVASDDPVLAAKILKLRTDMSEMDQYKRNTEDAQSWLEITESAVTGIQTVLQTARERAVQAANATNTAEDRKKISDEIKQLRKQLISDGNSTYTGRYIFSAFKNDKPFFKEDGTFNVEMNEYQITQRQTTEFQVGVGEELSVSSHGLDIYGYEKVDNIMTKSFPSEASEGTVAEFATLTGGFKLDQDYAARNLVIDVGGTDYTVDLTGLNGTGKVLSKEDIVARLKDAPGGAGKLSDVVDVLYDLDDKLVLKAKNFNTTPITVDAASDIGGAPYDYAPASVAQVNTGEALVLETAKVISDVDVAAATDTMSFDISYNGEKKSISVDMSGITTVAGPLPSLVATLQAQIDTEFGAGKITVGGTDGTSLGFITTGSPNDGSKPSLEVEFVHAVESTLIKKFDDFITALDSNDQAGIDKFLADIDPELNNVLTVRSDIGARVNRIELINKRLADNKITLSTLLSSAEDANMAEVIMYLKNSENVYKSSLSTGARVIQPSLIDFLR